MQESRQDLCEAFNFRQGYTSCSNKEVQNVSCPWSLLLSVKPDVFEIPLDDGDEETEDQDITNTILENICTT